MGGGTSHPQSSCNPIVMCSGLRVVLGKVVEENMGGAPYMAIILLPSVITFLKCSFKIVAVVFYLISLSLTSTL